MNRSEREEQEEQALVPGVPVGKSAGQHDIGDTAFLDGEPSRIRLDREKIRARKRSSEDASLAGA